LRCRLCGEERKLIEAHILARCLHEPLLHPSGPMMRLSKDAATPPRASQTGEYDTDILCAACDNEFSPWDKYARDLLFQPLPSDKVTTGPSGQKFYIIGAYDYRRLKLFFLSLLWRMSISRRKAFQNIRLGPFEEQIRARLLAEDPGRAEDFAVYINRYGDALGNSVMMESRQERLAGIRIYNVGLPGYIGAIKVDSQPIPVDIGPLVLNPDAPLIVGIRDMSAAPEGRFVNRILATQISARANRIKRKSNPR
jgi:hypothetical protein